MDYRAYEPMTTDSAIEDEPGKPPAVIKVVGVGGGGSNAVDRLAAEGIKGVELISLNTDAQALLRSTAPCKIQIGAKLTRGRGAGGVPEVGQRAAEESREELQAAVAGADMVFVTAGMGGGTGTGAVPVVAEIARASNALTVAVVTKPFPFEMRHRMRIAEEGIDKLAPNADTLIVIPNERLLQLSDQRTTFADAFLMADQVLQQGIRGISELVTVNGMVNLDLNDVHSIMANAGEALMSIGRGTGDARAVEAAQQAIANPLLEVTIDGATGVLFNITGGSDLTLREIDDAFEVVCRTVDSSAKIMFGAVIDPKLEDEVRITLIATGFPPRARVEKEEEEIDNVIRRFPRAVQPRQSADHEPPRARADYELPAFMRQPRAR